MKKRYFTSLLLFFILIFFGCRGEQGSSNEMQSPPAPKHDGMCKLIDLGEASDAVQEKMPNNQFVALQGMSSPKTLVWQEIQTKQIYYAAKIMGAEGKLFYMDTLKKGKAPTIKSSFQGTLMLWKHLPKALLISMKKQFKEKWNVEIDENKTYILIGNRKPEGCK